MKRTMIFLMGPINPATNTAQYQDSYTILAETLIDLKYIDQAVFLYNNSDKKLIKNKGEIIIDHIANLNFYNVKKTLAVFIRGNWQEHQAALKKIDYQFLYFYAADSQFLARYIKQDIINYFFVDNPEQKRIIKKDYPSAKALIFDKCVDDTVFKDLKLKKIYDLVYVANFRPWKNHNQLFSAIRKYQLKSATVLNLALVGNLNDNLAELKVMLYKYQIKAELFNQLPAIGVAEVFNKSKFSVQCGELDANPRSLIESLAANTPVLVNREIIGGKHLINPQTGHLSSLAKFDQAIELMLQSYQQYSPRKHYLKHFKNIDIAKTCFSDLIR